ncbi:MAG TPA: trypsin-like peptidase domain-containing protein [Thermoanaerobaculia bacterium]|nr:trypsin-like peptidase domain-containing protein [Thermoanaerobaculia bacterium]
MKLVRIAVLSLIAVAAVAQERVDSPCPMLAAALYDEVSPAVVSISAMSINPFDRNDRITRVSGSGVIVDPSGIVVTNSHLVFGRQVIRVTLDDGTMLTAKLLGADPVFDIAVIRIPAPAKGTLPVATFGDSDALHVGDDVYAIGNPMGLDQTMSRGIVSGINRLMPDVPYAVTEPLIQTDAPINPGNSGGPLVDDCGEVVGITTALLPSAQNIGFAIPSNLVKDVATKLMKDGRMIRPWLGVQGQLVAPDLKSIFRVPLVDGLLIEVVEPSSPAEVADLHGGNLEVMLGGQELLLGGDIITAIDAAPITSPEELVKALATLKVGMIVHLDIYRDGKTLKVECKLPERPVLPGDLRNGATLAGVAQKQTARHNPRHAF